eukprot:2999129-Prymnesium_polylepis.1
MAAKASERVAREERAAEFHRRFDPAVILRAAGVDIAATEQAPAVPVVAHGSRRGAALGKRHAHGRLTVLSSEQRVWVLRGQ